jgi:TRAP-type C4-dicarboxylate transport system permease small subunit
MGIPMSFVYAVLPLSGALMFIESVLRTWSQVRKRGEPA